MWSLTRIDSHDDFSDIYENHKMKLQNLVWIDRLTFILLYGSCFLITLLFSSTKWVWWVSVFPCLAQWDFVRALGLFCLHFFVLWLPVLCVHCWFFSLFCLHCLCLGYCLFLHISSSSSFPFLSSNCVCNAIQLLPCSPLCQYFHFLKKQWPLHVHRRETLLSAQYRSCLSTTVGQLL